MSAAETCWMIFLTAAIVILVAACEFHFWTERKHRELNA